MAVTRPRIALTVSRPGDARLAGGDTPDTYRAALERAQADVIEVRPADPFPKDVDGVLLSGGGDIDPFRYGQPNAGSEDNIDPDRDETELALARWAIDRDLPILGICRGLQVLNVAYGGGLVQHVDGHRRAGDTDDVQRHQVRARAGSKLAAAVGRTAATVNSHHHQVVLPRCLAAGWR